MKNAQHHSSLGNCKFKQRVTTIHLLEWLTSKKLTLPNADESAEEQELTFIAGGNTKQKTIW